MTHTFVFIYFFPSRFEYISRHFPFATVRCITSSQRGPKERIKQDWMKKKKIHTHI